MTRALRLALASLALALGCGEEIRPTYQVQIVGSLDPPFSFEGAQEVVLELNTRELARSTVTGRTLRFDAEGIDVPAGSSGVFRVRGFGPDGELVAFGQTQEIELQLATRALRVFVQRPGTFARSLDMEEPLRGHAAVPVLARPDGNATAQPVVVPFFGTGRALLPEGADGVREVLSSLLYIVNPLAFTVELLDGGGFIGGMPVPRVGATMLARPDNTVVVFGGETAPDANTAPTPTSALDLFRLWRVGFAEFVTELVGNTRTSQDPAVARLDAPLAAAGLTYAFGGRNADGALDSVVQIDTNAGNSSMTVLPPPARMAGPRVGHTATSVRGPTGLEVLVFGGGAESVAVAEVFVPGSGATFVPVAGDAGPPRRNHAALLVGDDVVIVGGEDANGALLTDSLRYTAADRTLSPGAITLRTPRRGFAAFVVNDDLVIAGGEGADETMVATAEIHDLKTGAVSEAPCAPRTRATPVVLPNQSALLIGGDERDRRPGASPNAVLGSPIVEVYQPRRL